MSEEDISLFSETACDELLNKFNLANGRIFFIGKNSQIENALNQLVDEFHLKLYFYEYSCHSYLLVILILFQEELLIQKNKPNCVQKN